MYTRIFYIVFTAFKAAFFHFISAIYWLTILLCFTHRTKDITLSLLPLKFLVLSETFVLFKSEIFFEFLFVYER